MDSELFELCKEVYKKTGWETGEWTNDGGDYVNPASDLIEAGIHFPLYTSDYLLDKLPRTTLLEKYASDNYQAACDASNFKFEADWVEVRADTPLKALLKLVLALDDAGVSL